MFTKDQRIRIQTSWSFRSLRRSFTNVTVRFYGYIILSLVYTQLSIRYNHLGGSSFTSCCCFLFLDRRPFPALCILSLIVSALLIPCYPSPMSTKSCYGHRFHFTCYNIHHNSKSIEFWNPLRNENEVPLFVPISMGIV